MKVLMFPDSQSVYQRIHASRTNANFSGLPITECCSSKRENSRPSRVIILNIEKITNL